MRPKKKGSQNDWFQLEAILRHKWQEDGSPLFEVKWEGYKETDNTWEPVENVLPADDHLREYLRQQHSDRRLREFFDKNGYMSGSNSSNTNGTPNVKSKNNKRSTSAASAEYPPATTKRRRKSESYANGSVSPPPTFPRGSWEPDVLHVCSVMDGGYGRLQGEIEWKDNMKTLHPLEELRQKCPQALLDYYEQHLVFRKTTSEEIKNQESTVTPSIPKISRIRQTYGRRSRRRRN